MPFDSTLAARAPQLLRVGVHVLVGVLLLIIIITAVADGDPEWHILVATTVLAGVYALGLVPTIHIDRRITYL